MCHLVTYVKVQNKIGYRAYCSYCLKPNKVLSGAVNGQFLNICIHLNNYIISIVLHIDILVFPETIDTRNRITLKCMASHMNITRA